MQCMKFNEMRSPAQMKPYAGTRRAEMAKRLRDALVVPGQTTIIQIGEHQIQAIVSRRRFAQGRLQSQREQQGPQRINLLNSCLRKELRSTKTYQTTRHVIRRFRGGVEGGGDDNDADDDDDDQLLRLSVVISC